MSHALNNVASIADLPALIYLQQVAHETIELVPENMREKARKIKIVIENYADKETLKSLQIDDKYELLGLYRGTPIPIKNIFQDSSLPDYIFLYRCPIIRYSIENQQLIPTLIHQVMMHELGHHFGNHKFL